MFYLNKNIGLIRETLFSTFAADSANVQVHYIDTLKKTEKS